MNYKEFYINDETFESLIIDDDVRDLYITNTKVKVLILSQSIKFIFFVDCDIETLIINEHIVTIDCEGCKIKHVIIPKDLKCVRSINFKDNLLTEFEHIIPSSISDIDLRNNNISEINVKLPRLFDFNISGNNDIKVKHVDFMFYDNIAPDMICHGDYLQVLFNIYKDEDNAVFLRKLFDKINGF